MLWLLYMPFQWPMLVRIEAGIAETNSNWELLALQGIAMHGLLRQGYPVLPLQLQLQLSPAILPILSQSLTTLRSVKQRTRFLCP